VTTSDPEKQYPVITGSRDIYEGRVIKVRVDEVELKDGLNVRREVVEHPGAVIVVPVHPDGSIVWERQYRYAADKYLMELPAGTLERGEDPEECARRELREEVGHGSENWKLLGRYYTAPGFCTEYMHCFLATDLFDAWLPGDDDEEIEVVTLSLEDTLAMIDAGECEDAKSLAAIHLYLRTLR
jgi:ADP-ribose pyrophosphatase